MTRYDRYGDQIDDDVVQTTWKTGETDFQQHAPGCRDGWLGEDDEGRPIPCLECRPHLRAKPR
ncbi:hypothetical protein [Pimelobacter simplex]|uniref:hypothetical protein n=1 Tax=Nocardioides simplex TaxID=2045 RepID=UPI0019333C88|nr:hypothetical protein [Pimelobacter simplex]